MHFQSTGSNLGIFFFFEYSGLALWPRHPTPRDTTVDGLAKFEAFSPLLSPVCRSWRLKHPGHDLHETTRSTICQHTGCCCLSRFRRKIQEHCFRSSKPMAPSGTINLRGAMGDRRRDSANNMLVVALDGLAKLQALLSPVCPVSRGWCPKHPGLRRHDSSSYYFPRLL